MSLTLTYSYQELNFNNTSNPVYSIINGSYTNIGSITLYTAGSNKGNAVLNITFPNLIVIQTTYIYEPLNSLISGQQYIINPFLWYFDNYDYLTTNWFDRVIFTIVYDHKSGYFTQTVTFNLTS
jgi:hypothetical protein